MIVGTVASVRSGHGLQSISDAGEFACSILAGVMDLLRLPVKHFISCSKAHDPHKTHQTQVIDSIYQPRTKNAQMLKWPRCVLRWLVLP